MLAIILIYSEHKKKKRTKSPRLTSKVRNMHCVACYSQKNVLILMIKVPYASFQWRYGLSKDWKIANVFDKFAKFINLCQWY